MSKQTVVFVDDDRFYAMRWIEGLRDSFEVQHFTDAESARLYMLNNVGVSAVVLDVMMPVPETASHEETNRGISTGLWLLEQIRQHVADNAIPVIVLTNRDLKGVQERVDAMKFYNGLVKVRRKLDTNRDRLRELVRDMVTRWSGKSS